MPIAVVTGASRGLGRALAAGLAERGWSLVVDARNPAELGDAADELRRRLAGSGSLVVVPGDVTDGGHRRELVDAAGGLGGLDLLVNNAGSLGASPLPRLLDYPPDVLRAVVEANVIAPLALIAQAEALLRRSLRPTVLDVTSDASVEHYEGWGGYAASKAALDHFGGTLATEEPWLRILTVDPGDMRTRMHQEAFPDEDISDRPLPEEVVPTLLALVEGDFPSRRYGASELRAIVAAAVGSGR